MRSLLPSPQRFNPKAVRRPLPPLLFALALLSARLLGAAGATPAESPARLECGSVPSAILGHAVDYCVALPPGYDASESTHYPTLYFLHGLFENERSWSEHGGEQIWEDLTQQEQLGKFLVVLPDGGKSFYVNS